MKKQKFTKHDEKELAQFLAGRRQVGALNLLQAKGFLFMVACCPDVIEPARWLPLVMGGEAGFGSKSELRAAVERLLGLYQQINQQVLDGQPKLPRECRILPDVMENFDAPAPIHDWSSGAMAGALWLGESWKESLGDEEYAEYNQLLFFLGAPGSRQIFERAFKVLERQRLELAETILAFMPQSLLQMVEFARRRR